MTKKDKKYSCDSCKAAPQSGQRPRSWQWKTERGFNNHNCYAGTSKRQVEEKEGAIRCEALFAKWLSLGLTGYKKGDKVFFVAHTVTHPTHQWRGDRQVRIRYDEKRQYYAACEEVEAIAPLDLDNNVDEQKLRDAIAEGLSYPYCYIALGQRVTQTFASLAFAKERANAKQVKHEEHLEFSAFVR